MPRKSAAAKAGDAVERPAKRRTANARGLWRLPPFAWILNGGRPGRPVPAPSRILCATLPEAFLLAASLKEAEVVALVARDDGAGLVIWLHQRLFGAARIAPGRDADEQRGKERGAVESSLPASIRRHDGMLAARRGACRC